MQKIIEMWQYAWNTYLSRVRADKFWHFILLLFGTITLLMFPNLNLYATILLSIFAGMLFYKSSIAIKSCIIIGMAILISAILFPSGVRTLIIVSGFAIGKELWDWNHGRYFDFGDLMADAVGIFLAYVINGVYIRILT